MEILPAIDIRGGRCVRLFQGDYAQETVFDDDPIAVALRWAEQGASMVHVVDLDGARDGSRVNAETVRRIAESIGAGVQTGGGIRTIESVRAALDLGIARVVLGTAALKDEAMLREAVVLAGDRLVVSVDARDGRVRTDGWTQDSTEEALPFIDYLDGLGVRRIVYTEISRDGASGGPDVLAYERLAAETSVAIIAAGGVTTLEDVRRLAACGIEAAIIGRALYTGEIDLAEALRVARDPAADGRA